MTAIPRTDTSLVGRWWWTVDRWTLAALLLIIAAGAVLVLAASPAVAERLHLGTFYFAKRQFLLIPVVLATIFGISLLTPTGVRRLAVFGFVVSMILLASTVQFGSEIKGATRWLSVFGISLQPSEFVKPTFAVVAAWMFAVWRLNGNGIGCVVAVGLYLLVIALLLMQPDVGMAIVVSLVWGVQFFLAGLPMILVGAIGLIFLAGGFGAYFAFDHVQNRVDQFLDPAGGQAYQVARSLEAFEHGGLIGLGPGEGQVKAVLPDAHADFVFAVAGEEFGLLAVLLIVGLFAFVVLRGFSRVLQDANLFAQLAVAGLLAQFGLQAIINIASTVNLMPTKGMTLPFISYGGSSMLALAIGMGMVLALTRERSGHAMSDGLPPGLYRGQS
jgi:cell division protein FtsW